MSRVADAKPGAIDRAEGISPGLVDEVFLGNVLCAKQVLLSLLFFKAKTDRCPSLQSRPKPSPTMRTRRRITKHDRVYNYQQSVLLRDESHCIGCAEHRIRTGACGDRWWNGVDVECAHVHPSGRRQTTGDQRAAGRRADRCVWEEASHGGQGRDLRVDSSHLAVATGRI